MTSSAIAALVSVMCYAPMVSHSEADPRAILALIHVESKGDPCAHRARSQYHGLLQMGRLAGVDAGMRDRGTDTTAGLHCNERQSILAFFAYMDRWEDRHHWTPIRMAILWKGGPSAALLVEESLDEDAALHDALALAERRYGITGLVQYVDRYKTAVAVYDDYESAQEEACPIQ